MAGVLFVRPKHDDVTSYLHFYSRKLIEFAESRGFNSLNKEGEKAEREEVASVIEKKDPIFIMFNGHGNPSCICGHKDQILIKEGENHVLLKKRLVYALSCSSALSLGRRAVEDGTIAFVGYEDEFALGMDGYCQTSIQRDKIARRFLEPSNLLVESLLKGNSVGGAVTKAKEAMQENISQLKTDPFSYAIDYVPYLYNNYLVLVLHGDDKAVLS